MMVIRDSRDMVQESSTELGIVDHVRKESGWMTNLFDFAAILEGIYSTQMSKREWIDHTSQIIDQMSFRSSTPLKLVAEVLTVLKRNKIQEGCLSSLESK